MQIVHLIDDFFCNVGVVLMTTWSWNAKIKYFWHRNPKVL